MLTPDLDFTAAELDFLRRIEQSLDTVTRRNFDDNERHLLIFFLRHVGLADYPPVVGPPLGTRAAANDLCPKCGKCYVEHPPDWRVINHQHEPFLTVLCDGVRVRL